MQNVVNENTLVFPSLSILLSKIFFSTFTDTVVLFFKTFLLFTIGSHIYFYFVLYALYYTAIAIFGYIDSIPRSVTRFFSTCL